MPKFIEMEAEAVIHAEGLLGDAPTPSKPNDAEEEQGE